MKERELQDPKDKRFFLADDRMFAVFKKKRINGFTMNRDIQRHIFGFEEPLDVISPKPKRPRAEESSSSKATKKVKKEGGSGGGGFAKPVRLSAVLADFMGKEMASRTEVVKRLWEQIKENGLQDPADKRRIIADATLQRLLGVSEFTGFSMNKYLKEHFLKE